MVQRDQDILLLGSTLTTWILWRRKLQETVSIKKEVDWPKGRQFIYFVTQPGTRPS